MRIIEFEEMQAVLAEVDLLPAIEEGFVAYSAGKAVVPPVGELTFAEPPGEVHIKYGYLKGEQYYVIKIASGFYENPALGLPSGEGVMLLFEQRTGRPVALLNDHGYLTDLRTAVAGAIAARYLAPAEVSCMGVLGTGVQARLQVRHLATVTPCRDVVVWGRRSEAVEKYQADMEKLGYRVEGAASPAEVAARSNLIVTTTASRRPLLEAADVRPGTHLTAMGSDTVGKQELAADILAQARVVVDSRSQCVERGEAAHALEAGLISADSLTELGEVIEQQAGRQSEEEITVADLTGVAVQDMQIAKAVAKALL